VPDIEVLPWRRTHVLAVQVHPSSTRPPYLMRGGLDGGVYVRVGSTNRRADRELVEELRRFVRGEPFDEQPMPGLDSIRKRWTSERLPSRSRPRASSLDATSKPCVS
jgi:predicted HTH transcriptional regulator